MLYELLFYVINRSSLQEVEVERLYPPVHIAPVLPGRGWLDDDGRDEGGAGDVGVGAADAEVLQHAAEVAYEEDLRETSSITGAKLAIKEKV